MDASLIDVGDTVVVRRPDGEIESWRITEIHSDGSKVAIEHKEKTEMQKTSQDNEEELPVSRQIDIGKFEKMLDKDTVSLLKDPLEQLYFYGDDA